MLVPSCIESVSGLDCHTMAFYVILNFVISFINAWGCGKTWADSKRAGGFERLLVWSAAIMSAAGFTWCYTLIFAGIGTVVDSTNDAGAIVPLVSDEAFQKIASLSYLMVIFPVIGSGVVITINSWRNFLKRRSLANGVETAWNTYAQTSNMINAVDAVPEAIGGLDDLEIGEGTIVLFFVALGLFTGILTTSTIIVLVAQSVAKERRYAQIMARSNSF